MGKNYTAPPDYGPLAEASAEAARVQTELGRDQLAFAREQYERTSPLLEGIANQQMAAQEEQMAQARDYYNYRKDTYRPLERSIVADAENFNTEGYRRQIAGKAAADSARAFGISQQQNQRAAASMGINPNSGRYAGMQQATGLQQAASRANAMTGARTQAEQMGYARKLDAAGLGRGLSGASTAAYGGASAAGNMAGINTQAVGQNYMGNLAVGAGTIAQGQNMQLGGLSTILNGQVETYINTQDSFLSDLGGVLGGVAGVVTASDARVKEGIKQVRVDERTGLNIYEFSYKGDPRRFEGVIAQEVEKVYPYAVAEQDGIKGVYYQMLGLEMMESE